MTCKEIIKALAGGVTGASIFIASCMVLNLMTFVLFLWGVNITYYQVLSLNNRYLILIVAGTCGFVLGVAKRNSFVIKRYSIISIALLIPASLILVIWYYVAGGTETVRYGKLCNCTGGSATITFVTPKGYDFYVLMTPKSNSALVYTSHIHIIDEKANQSSDFEATSNPFQSLNQHDFLRPQTEYRMTVTFLPPTPPSSMVVSLQWMQRIRDKNSELFIRND
jgi:hypothetical protein